MARERVKQVEYLKENGNPVIGRKREGRKEGQPQGKSKEEEFVEVEENQGNRGNNEANPAEHVHNGRHKTGKFLDETGTRGQFNGIAKGWKWGGKFFADWKGIGR
jgi:hypothetical protein